MNIDTCFAPPHIYNSDRIVYGSLFLCMPFILYNQNIPTYQYPFGCFCCFFFFRFRPSRVALIFTFTWLLLFIYGGCFTFSPISHFSRYIFRSRRRSTAVYIHRNVKLSVQFSVVQTNPFRLTLLVRPLHATSFLIRIVCERERENQSKGN